MFIFKKLNSLIITQDMNGTVVNFNFFKNSNKHKSFCGGLFSLIFLISLIYFGFTKFVQMIRLDNTLNSSSVYEVDPHEIYIPDLK